MRLEDINRKDFLNIGGIYIIRNNIDDRVYIGSCKSFYNRLIHHKNSLIGNYSGCKKLLFFVNKYGIDCLDIELIQYDFISRDELFNIEKEYILKYNSVNIGLNCSENTVVPQVPFTEERRRKIGIKSIGRKHSENTCKKLSENCHWNNCLDKHPNAKFKNEDIIKIKKMLILGYRVSEIAYVLNKNYKTIYNIKCGNKWSSLVVNSCDISKDDIDNYSKLFSCIKDKIIRSDGGLTLNNVSEIKHMINNDFDKKYILSKFNISIQCFNSIKTGRNYSYVV